MCPVVTLFKMVGKGYRRVYEKFQSFLSTGRFLSTSACAGRGLYAPGVLVKGTHPFAFLSGQTDVSGRHTSQDSRERL